MFPPNPAIRVFLLTVLSLIPLAHSRVDSGLLLDNPDLPPYRGYVPLRVPGFPGWFIQRYPNEQKGAFTEDAMPIRKYLHDESTESWQFWDAVEVGEGEGDDVRIDLEIMMSNELVQVTLPLPDIFAEAKTASSWMEWLSGSPKHQAKSQGLDFPKFIRAFYRKALPTTETPRMLRADAGKAAKGTRQAVNNALAALGHRLGSGGGEEVSVEIEAGAAAGWPELAVESNEFYRLARGMEQEGFGRLAHVYVYRGAKYSNYDMIAAFR